MADFSDPQIQAIYQAILSGQFSPQNASELAGQLTETDEPGAKTRPGEQFAPFSAFKALQPFIGSSGAANGDPFGPFSPGTAYQQGGEFASQNPQPQFTGFSGPDNSPTYSTPAPPDFAQSDAAAQSDMQYLLTHGFDTPMFSDPGFRGMDALRIFGPVLAGPILGAAGEAIGAAADAGSAASEGAAAGGTFGEAGTSFGGLEAASGTVDAAGAGTGSAAAASGFEAGTSADAGIVPGSVGNDAVGAGLADAGTSFTMGPDGTFIVSAPAPTSGNFAAGVGGGLGAGGVAGAADPTGGGLNQPQNSDVGGTTGTNIKAIQPGVAPGQGSGITTETLPGSGTSTSFGPQNPTAPNGGTDGAFTDPAGPTSDAGGVLPSTGNVQVASLNDAQALTATDTGTFGPAAAPVSQASPIAPVSGGGAGGGATLGSNSDFLSDSSLAELNSNNPALTASMQQTGLSTPSESSGILDSVKNSGAFQFVKNNASWLYPLTTGGVAAITGATSGSPKASSDVGQVAGQERAAGSTLLNDALNGTLPPGLQQNLEAAKAAIRSKYAVLGQSGSVSEQMDIANITAQMTGNAFNSLVQEGTSLLGNAAAQYGDLARTQLTSDQELEQALANFGLAAGFGAVKGA